MMLSLTSFQSYMKKSNYDRSEFQKLALYDTVYELTSLHVYKYSNTHQTFLVDNWCCSCLLAASAHPTAAEPNSIDHSERQIFCLPRGNIPYSDSTVNYASSMIVSLSLGTKTKHCISA